MTAEPLDIGAGEAPCLGPRGGEGCPTGEVVPTWSIFGHVFRAKCASCRAADDEAEAAEELASRVAAHTTALTNRLPARHRGWTLDTYPQELDQVARARCLAWLDGYRVGSRSGLYLWGQVGRGKTGLAVGIARGLVADGVEAQVVNWREWLHQLRESFSDASRRPEPLERVEVLVLDDLGAERPTEHAREELATLVDRRYLGQRATVMTANYRPSELAARLGHDDPVVGQRIVSRLTDDAVIVRVEGDDQRAPRMSGSERSL